MTPLVDTHVHFWDLLNPTLRYPWLAERRDEHPRADNIACIAHLRYDPRAYHAETRFAGVTKCVHVEAAAVSVDPLAETVWLSALADEFDMPNGIVAHVELSEGSALSHLEQHRAFPRFRGVRDMAVLSAFDQTCTRRALEALADAGLVLDLLASPAEIDAALRLVRTSPELLVVIEHAGFPEAADDGHYALWATAMSALAAEPNTVCKLSGLGMCIPRWTVESLQPWVRHCLDVFGAQRCMFGSNWPVDRLFSSFDSLAAAFHTLLGHLAPDEQQLVFAGTAERVYRL